METNDQTEDCAIRKPSPVARLPLTCRWFLIPKVRPWSAPNWYELIGADQSLSVNDSYSEKSS